MVKKLVEEQDPKNSYEGIALIVLCESLDEREKAKEIAIKNPNFRVVMAIPTKDIPIKEYLVRLLATENAFTNNTLSEQELVFVEDRRKIQASALATQIKQYMDERNLSWYGKDGTPLVSSTREDYQAVSSALQIIYDGKRTRFKHNDINRMHSVDRTALNILKDAVERILTSENEIIWDTNKAEDTADIRIFNRFLAPANIIEIVEENRTIKKGKFQKNISVFEDTIPLLAALIKEIDNNRTESTSITTLTRICSEYGAGHVATCLFIAIALRYFSEGLYIKSTPHAKNSLIVDKYSLLEDLVIKKKYINAVIDIIELTEEEKNFLNELYQVYENASLTKNITVDECFEVLEKWYESLPPICKVKGFYDDIRYHNLIDIFSGMKGNSSPNFIIRKLQTIVGIEEENLMNLETKEKIIDFLRLAKLEMQLVFNKVKNQVYEQLISIFSDKTDTIKTEEEALKKALLSWYDTLSEVQKNLQSSKHTSESRYLVSVAGTCINVDKSVLEELPDNFGLQIVMNWGTDKLGDLIAKVKQAKYHIENNVVEVEDAKVKIPESWSQVKEGKDTVIYFLPESTIEIDAPGEGITVFLTDNGKDPVNDQNRKEIQGVFHYLPNCDEVTINLVTMDNKGRYGLKRKIILRAQKLKYEARDVNREEQQEIDVDQLEVKQSNEDSLFIQSIPHDKYSLEICVNSIINKAITKKDLPVEEVKKALRNLINLLEE